MNKTYLPILSALLLAACGNSSTDYSDSSMAAPEAVMMEKGQVFSADEAQSRGMPPEAPTANDNPSSQSFMAYRYNYGFMLPVIKVSETAKYHAELCMKAGSRQCQVLHSSVNSNGDDYVNAQLQIRGEPKWLETFKAEIQSSVADADGDLTSSSVNAQDLTRQILDTDARLKAKKTLRRRLENHLETRDAKLADLLSIERELARVQGEIESATTNLNVLKKRVSMSVVDINYQGRSVAVSSNAISPIGSALKDFVRDISYGLASVIRFFAAILPWLIFVIIPGLWLLRRYWRSRKSKGYGKNVDKAES